MTPDHLDDDTWERLATGELPADDRARAMAHLVGCPRCARAWRVTRIIAREAATFDPGVPVAAPTERSDGVATAPRMRIRRGLWISGGAALAAAAALLLWVRSERGPQAVDGDAMRGGQPAAVELIAPAPGPETRLAWRPVAAARHYVVVVFSADGRLVWRDDRVTTVELTVAPPLPAGRYLWQVEAWADGRRIATSTPSGFAVTP